MTWNFSETPAARVLKAIQLRGKASTKDVAADLEVTASAVRLHLTQLQARGLIRAQKVREGVGRPHYLYSLAPAAQNLLYKDYGELATLLLEEVYRTQGANVLEEILRGIGERLVETYRPQVEGQALGDRVQAWVDVLDKRGVSVKAEETAEGYVLRRYGCPYATVNKGRRAVCEMERQVMVRLLGSSVRLDPCALDSCEGCTYVVTQNNQQMTRS